jgi:hypothetical protein
MFNLHGAFWIFPRLRRNVMWSARHRDGFPQHWGMNLCLFLICSMFHRPSSLLLYFNSASTAPVKGNISSIIRKRSACTAAFLFLPRCSKHYRTRNLVFQFLNVLPYRYSSSILVVLRFARLFCISDDARIRSSALVRQNPSHCHVAHSHVSADITFKAASDAEFIPKSLLIRRFRLDCFQAWHLFVPHPNSGNPLF